MNTTNDSRVIPPSDNEYSDQEISDIIDSVSEGLAKGMADEAKADNVKAAAAQKKSDAYIQMHNVFEALGLDRDGKATDYRANGVYQEIQRDCCIALSKKLKDPVAAGARGAPRFSQRVSKAWSRLVTAYREDGDNTQSEADVKNKAKAAEVVKMNKEKGALFDVLVQTLRDPDGTDDQITVIHQRMIALAEVFDAKFS
jgi:hypothetical protein